MSTTVSYKGNTIATLNNETKTLTTAGTWVEGNITVTDTKDNPTLQAKTNITPIQSSQTITADSGYDGLSSVQINAIPESYKDSIIFTVTYDENTGDLESITCNKSYSVCSVSMNDAYDYSAIYVEKEGDEYSISAMTGREVYDSSSNEYILKYTLTDSNFIISYHQDGTITAAERNASATTPATTITANPSISVDSSTGLITATASASQSITPTVVAGHINSGTTGTVTVSGSNTSQLSIQAGTTITPNESEQTAVSAGKYTTGAVKIGAISSTYVGSGITRRSSTDLTVSGGTVNSPAGYYAEAASKSVASGTEGTPTATKGTVSNHSISITPSVTNSAGYITGSTKTGTAVTVTASELASGNKEITQNGTNIDVVGYSTVSVAVEGEVSMTDVANTTGTTAVITGETTALTTKTITQNGTYTASTDGADGYSSVTVNVSGGGSGSGVMSTSTGTFTGSGGNTVQISCDFEPQEIYITGDLTSDVSLRGIVSFTMVKDILWLVTNDTSTSSASEGPGGLVHDITGYNQSNSDSQPYATYSNGVLTLNTVVNSSGYRFVSGITYSYKLIGMESPTQHTIHLEFSDNTETDIEIYHDDSLISTMITNYIPVNWSYSNKTVVLAQLDGVTWYDRPVIPLNTQLVDYTKVKLDYGIDDATGEEKASQWASCSDYTPINSTMTFSYVNYRWHTIHYYDMNKAFMFHIKCEDHNDTIDSNDYAHGTLNSSNIPPNAGYVRFNCSYGADNNAELSLIRTA